MRLGDLNDYLCITVDNITPKLGAEIGGADLADLSAEAVADIRRAFRERMVLVFRDQHLSRDQHKAFGRLFGELHLHPAKVNLGVAGDAEIFDIKISAKTQVANGEAWHSDLTCEEIPPLASALYITQVPSSGGGDTLFANMHEMYESLSEPIRTMLSGLTAYHSGYKDLKAYGFEPKPGQTYPTASHPVVVRHPETDKPVLWVNEPFTERINELSPRESLAVLDMLHRHVEANTRFHCRVKWQPTRWYCGTTARCSITPSGTTTLKLDAANA